jgi:8-oxo-dGTP pyrophosphatase MutT (NUDIX family)
MGPLKFFAYIKLKHPKRSTKAHPKMNTSVSRRFPTANRTRNPFQKQIFPRPMPGKTEVYGAIIHCTVSNKYCLVQGSSTGKWSFPKGHRNKLQENPPVWEDPFACVVREVGEEIGIDKLPMPLREYPLRVGYYYVFEVPFELPLDPRDTNEIGAAGWFSMEEITTMNLNIDASMFRRQWMDRRV